MKALELEGSRFGKLTVLRRAASRHGCSRWLCRCDCGTEKEAYGQQLTSGKTTTCGCRWFEDLTGFRFGRLLVLKRYASRGRGCSWFCRCDCGRECVGKARQLVRAEKKSCGCIRPGLKGQSRVVQPGTRFGRLIVVEHVGFKGGHAMFKFRCDCGSEKVISAHSVKVGDTRSCGCFRKEKVWEARKFLPGHDGKAGLRYFFKCAQGIARKRGIEFALDLDIYETLVKAPCIYCGQPAQKQAQRKKYAEYAMNGIDRINSAKGYLPGNVLSCCWTCNRAKGVMTVEEFGDWIERVYKNCKDAV